MPSFPGVRSFQAPYLFEDIGPSHSATPSIQSKTRWHLPCLSLPPSLKILSSSFKGYPRHNSQWPVYLLQNTWLSALTPLESISLLPQSHHADALPEMYVNASFQPVNHVPVPVMISPVFIPFSLSKGTKQHTPVLTMTGPVITVIKVVSPVPGAGSTIYSADVCPTALVISPSTTPSPNSRHNGKAIPEISSISRYLQHIRVILSRLINPLSPWDHQFSFSRDFLWSSAASSRLSTWCMACDAHIQYLCSLVL